MSDNITPTNTPPATTTPSPLPAASKESGITVIRNAAVVSAPPAATPPADAKTITLRAVVVEDKSLPPDQTRLRTEKGDIIVRSETRLPPDTEVMIDLQRQKTELTANVRVAQRSAEMQPPAPQQPAVPPAPTTPPPQTVQAGDKLIALILSGSVAPPPAPPAPPPLTNDQAALIRQAALQLLASGGAAKATVPLSVLTGLTASTDPAAFIKTLPPEQQAALRLLLPASAQAPATVPTPVPQAPPTAPPSVPAATTPQQQAAEPAPLQPQQTATPAEPQDAGLLTLLKAMTSARLTEQALQTPQTAQGSGNALTNLVKSMLPLIQGLQSQGMTQPLATPAPQTTPLFGTQQPSGAELRIITITPPPAGNNATPPLAAQPQPLPQGQIEGTIIGQTREGMAVIKTPVADFVLSSRINLPIGTTLTLQATPLTLSDLAAKLSANPAALSTLLASFDPLSGDSWPALDEAMSILAQARPEAAARMANTVPSPGPKMVPTTLFFLAALRLGIAENWLGAQTLQALRDSGGRSTADKLTGDFGRIARQSGEALPGEWRGISMPLMYDSQLSQLQMFVRKQKDDEGENASGGKTTRFIVNLNLSRLGGMQLDGLMHDALPAKNIDKRLDMVIRTDTRLSPGIMQDLQTAYAAGLKDSKMTGSLEFQANKKGWVDIDHRTADSRSV